MIVYMDLENLLKEKNISKNKLCAIGGLHQTVLRSKTDAMRSERTKLIQL